MMNIALPGTPVDSHRSSHSDDAGPAQVSAAFLDDDAKHMQRMVDKRTAKVKAEIRDFQERVGERVTKFREKISELRKQNDELLAENNRLCTIINAGGGQSGPGLDFHALAAAVKKKTSAIKTAHDRRQERRVQMRQGLVMDVERFEMENYDEYYEDEESEDLNVCQRAFRVMYRRIAACLYGCLCFKKDIASIQIRYGVGMAAYFAFYRYMFVSTSVLVLGWSMTFCYQVIQYAIDKRDKFFVTQGLYPKFFFYSSLVIPVWVFVLSMVFTIMYLTLASIFKLALEHRKSITGNATSQYEGTFRYSAVTLNAWDYKCVSRREINDATLVTTQYLKEVLHEDHVAEQIANRTQFERAVLHARKIIGLFFNVVVILISSAVVIGVSLYKKSITKNMSAAGFGVLANYIVPTVLAFIKTIFPLITIAITEFEKHDDSAELLKHQMWRLFFGKQTFVMALVGVSFRTIQTNQSFEEETYVCIEDEIGVSLFNAALIEFFTSKIAVLMTHLVKASLRRAGCCCKCMDSMLAKEEFRASEGVVDLIYFQSLVWVSVPLFPFGGVLCTLFLYFNFKFEKYTLLYFRGAPRATKSLGIEFVTFLMLSVVSINAIYVWFLTVNWDCENSGLFNNRTPVDAVLAILDRFNLRFVVYASWYCLLMLIFLILYLFSRNHNFAKQQQLKELQKLHAKESAALNKTIQRQALTLEVVHDHRGDGFKEEKKAAT